MDFDDGSSSDRPGGDSGEEGGDQSDHTISSSRSRVGAVSVTARIKVPLASKMDLDPHCDVFGAIQSLEGALESVRTAEDQEDGRKRRYFIKKAHGLARDAAKRLSRNESLLKGLMDPSFLTLKNGSKGPRARSTSSQAGGSGDEQEGHGFGIGRGPVDFRLEQFPPVAHVQRRDSPTRRSLAELAADDGSQLASERQRAWAPATQTQTSNGASSMSSSQVSSQGPSQASQAGHSSSEHSRDREVPRKEANGGGEWVSKGTARKSIRVKRKRLFGDESEGEDDEESRRTGGGPAKDRKTKRSRSDAGEALDQTLDESTAGAMVATSTSGRQGADAGNRSQLIARTVDGIAMFGDYVVQQESLGRSTIDFDPDVDMHAMSVPKNFNGPLFVIIIKGEGAPPEIAFCWKLPFRFGRGLSTLDLNLHGHPAARAVSHVHGMFRVDSSGLLWFESSGKNITRVDTEYVKTGQACRVLNHAQMFIGRGLRLEIHASKELVKTWKM